MQRRQFLLGAASAALAAPAPQSASPNDRIQIATIGLGNRGSYDTRQALKIPGVQLVAGSDLYSGRRERARELYGNDLFVTPDYREVLARKDVDAVIVTTPDHWHAQASIDAMLAGKDVYCEKPMVHSIAEGHEVIATHRKSQRIMEVGSQRVSSVIYRKAQQLIQDGVIGHLNLIEAWWDRPGDNDEAAFRPSIAPDASTATIDWDRFVSNTHKVPFDPKRFFWWHNYRDYGTGIPGDLFVHLFSGVNFVLQSNGPERVVSTGGTRFFHDGREIPDIMLAMCDYPAAEHHPAFNLTLRVNFARGAEENSGFHFVGDEGVLSLEDDMVRITKYKRRAEPGYAIDTFPAKLQAEYVAEYRKKYPSRGSAPVEIGGTEDFAAPPGYSDHLDHLRNFFDSVRTRRPVVEDPLFGLRAAGPALLANESLYQQKICRWDPHTAQQI